MKITVGIDGQIDEPGLIKLASLGADEFFCGVLPKEWYDIYGSSASTGRRTWMLEHYDDWNKLKKAISVIHSLKKKIIVAFNALSYYEEQYPLLLNFVKISYELGVDALIVSDMELLFRILELNYKIDIHISSESGTYNTATAALFASLGAKRIIFPRHMTIEEMRGIIAGNKNLEYECFIMEQRCPFDGAYCTPVHGWLKSSFCQEDFKRTLHKHLGNERVTVVSPDEYIKWKDNRNLYEIWAMGVNSYDSILMPRDYDIMQCGLCSIKKLAEIGITSLKISSRGFSLQSALSVQLIGKVLRNADFSEAYCKSVRANPGICDMKYMCYYR